MGWLRMRETLFLDVKLILPNGERNMHVQTQADENEVDFNALFTSYSCFHLHD